MYISVQLSLIAIFLNLDLDFLCAGRTAPCHSWSNPVERIMAILNLGMQCVGLMRQEMPEELEKEAKKCNSMADLQRIAQNKPELVAASSDSISPVKILLSDVFHRLELKSKKFQVVSSATPAEIDDFWTAVLSIDDASDMYTKKTVADSPQLKNFLDHCCRIRLYSFGIKKSGSPTCSICKPVRLPPDVFATLHHLLDPILGSEGHFLPFQDVFGTSISEKYRPSLIRKKSAVTPLLQHAKNANVLLQCDECGKWRLVYSLKKLTTVQHNQLMATLEGMSFSCGAPLEDLDLPDGLPVVFVKELSCSDPTEKLHYSVGHEAICYYCGTEQEMIEEETDVYYPVCCACSGCEKVKKYGK